MVAVAIALLLPDEVVLRPVAAFDAFGQLQLLRVVAAVAQPRLAVVATDARLHGDVAGDVVQAVARIVGTAHHLDAVDLQREQHVQIGHVAVIAVARDAVDQQLDRVDLALAIEATKGQLAGAGALAELGEHHPRRTTEQLPAIEHRLLFEDVAAQQVHRADHAAGRQATTRLGGGDGAAAQRKRGGGAIGKACRQIGSGDDRDEQTGQRRAPRRVRRMVEHLACSLCNRQSRTANGRRQTPTRNHRQVQAVQAWQRGVTPAASGEGRSARVEGRPLLPWRRSMDA